MKVMCQNIAKSVQVNFAKLVKCKMFYVYACLLALIVPALFCEWFILPVIALALAVSVFAKIDDALAVVFGLYSFFSIFIINDNNLYFLLFAGVVGVLAVRYLIQVFKKQKKLDWLLIGFVAAYCLFVMLPIRKTVDGGFSSICELKNIASIGVFFVLLYLCNAFKTELNFLKIIRAFVIGFLIAGALGLFVFVSARLDKVITIIYYHGHDLMRYSGLFSIPNTLAIFALVAFVVVLYLMFENKLNLIESHIYLSLSFLLGYVTLARSFLYASIIAIAIYFVAVIFKEKKQCYKKILPIIAEIAIIMLVCFSFSEVHFKRAGVNDLVNGYHNLANSENLDKVSDPGRGGLIKKYLKDYLSSVLVILFGRGMSFGWLGGLSSHNTFLQAFWNTGFVGVLILVAVVCVFIKKFTNLGFVNIVKKGFSDWGLYILLIPVLAIMFIENLFMNMQMMIVVLMVVFAMCLVKVQNNDESIEQEDEKQNK